MQNGRHLTYSEAENIIYKHLCNVGDQDVIAFSGKITTLRWQEKVAKIVNENSDLASLVMGTHASALPERTLTEEPYNFVCEGEGAKTIVGTSNRPRIVPDVVCDFMHQWISL